MKGQSPDLQSFSIIVSLLSVEGFEATKSSYFVSLSATMTIS